MAEKTKSIESESLLLDGDDARATKQSEAIPERTKALPRHHKIHLEAPEEIDLDQELFETDIEYVRSGADRIVSRLGTMLFKLRAQEERILKAEEDRDQWRAVVDAMVGNDEVTGQVNTIQIPKWPVAVFFFGLGLLVCSVFFTFFVLRP